MDLNKADKLIVKLINNEITSQESKRLNDWLQKDENLSYFNEFVKLSHLINSKKDFNSHTSLDKFKSMKKVIPFYKRAAFKYAATILLLISTGYLFYQQRNMIEDTNNIINNNINPGVDKAILTLEDGTDVILDTTKHYTTNNLKSNGKQIVYKPTKTTKEIAYNYLTIPRGGQYQIKLTDGTQVWLNSESQLKYPVNFIEGEVREVELVYGEAYFEVSPSNQHFGSHFRVFNNHQEIEVLGTKFNVKAYKDESSIYTTLVEGSVGVTINNNHHILAPNQQLKLSLTDYGVKLEEVNASIETAWIHGEFKLQHKTLKEIMTVLSRWYDMDVTFSNKDLEKVKFVGVLRKNQNIVELLNTIKGFNIITEYKINNKKVILE